MKTTRRGWLTALSSLVALPLLPKSGTATADSGEPPRSLADHFARLSFKSGPDQRLGMEAWEEAIRVPVTTDEVRVREEFVQDSLHHQRAQGGGCHLMCTLEAELRDIELARTLLAHLPTGRPLSFRYISGRSPGQSRAVLPTLVFHTDSPSHQNCILDGNDSHRRLYLQAYCLERLAPRTFRLDRIKDLAPLA